MAFKVDQPGSDNLASQGRPQGRSIEQIEQDSDPQDLTAARSKADRMYRVMAEKPEKACKQLTALLALARGYSIQDQISPFAPHRQDDFVSKHWDSVPRGSPEAEGTESIQPLIHEAIEYFRAAKAAIDGRDKEGYRAMVELGVLRLHQASHRFASAKRASRAENAAEHSQALDDDVASGAKVIAIILSVLGLFGAVAEAGAFSAL
jgi:hypothetical protein